MKVKNLKEFKALKKRYEDITLKEIKPYKDKIYVAAYLLTGFGIMSSCSLCIKGCSECVYESSEETHHCLYDENKKTYSGVTHADTPLKLLNAYRARAEHMGTLIK